MLEIQPIDFYMHLVDKGLVAAGPRSNKRIRRVCEIGDKLGKPVIATGNVHYLHPRDKMFRDITIHGITGFSPLKDISASRTLISARRKRCWQEFAFLGEEKAYEVVVKNTVELADRFEPFDMFPTQAVHADHRRRGRRNPRHLLRNGEEACTAKSCRKSSCGRLEKELDPDYQIRFLGELSDLGATCEKIE